jgi:hypothetical protein
VQHLGLNGIGAAHQCGVMRHRLEPETTELTQHQAVADEVLGLGVALRVQVLDHQHAQDDLDRCGGASRHGWLWPPSAELGTDVLKEPIVVQQPVQFG